MPTSTNPLIKHFRQPTIYLKLPSGGRHYPPNSINLSIQGEIPIYPMTVKDELTLKTPDALMNGESMITILKSCCPDILDPWSIPSIDIDAILIAIRLASYGSNMDINTKCPHCQAENDNTINLTSLLETVPAAAQSTEVLIDKLIFKFKPPTYKNINQLNIKTFEERRLINNIINSELPDEEKTKAFNESFQKLTDLNLNQVLSNIESITVDGNKVTDQNQISEFLNNTSRQVYVEIREKAQSFLNSSKVPPIKLACSNCTKEFETNLEFDQANFFG